MTSDEVIALECIRRTINTCTIAGDIRNVEMFCGQFAEGGILDNEGNPPVPGFKLEGRDAIRTLLEGFKKLPADSPLIRSFVRHNVTTCHIELTGEDTATAKTYFIVFTNVGADHAGTYSDTFVRQGAHWLISYRKIALDWSSEASIYFPTTR